MTRLIYKDELMKYVHDVTLANGARHRCIDATVIYDLPTVDAEPVRHGRWKKAEPHGAFVYSDAYRQCSECNDVIYLAFKMNYCPTCGARMDEE